MSKIFDAFKKNAGDLSDLPVSVGQAGSVSLYPVPRGAQKADFSKLANRLLGFRKEGSGVTLAFGSSAPKEGSSFVSYNTALFLAIGYNQKVAWIDGNFLSPQNKLLWQPQCSFSSLLKDPSSVSALVTSENPLLIPGGNDLPECRGFLASDNYREVLRNMSSHFDFVILDLPPVLSSTDTALMAAGTDGFLLVVEQKKLKIEVIEHGLQGLKGKGAHILGSVINRRTFELPKFIYDRL